MTPAEWQLSGYVKAWSYSAWALWALCPLKYKLQRIDKLKEPQSPQMARGEEVHNAIAAYLKGKAPFPEIVACNRELIRELDAFPHKMIEQQWAFSSRWIRTGWFDHSCWYRMVGDVVVMYEDNTAEIVDWKTGKRYGSNDDQMETFAIGLLRNAVALEHVTTRLAYVDTNETEFAEFPRADLEPLQAKWEAKVRPMFEDTEFLPRPNDKCRFCHYRRSNGGPCRYG